MKSIIYRGYNLYVEAKLNILSGRADEMILSKQRWNSNNICTACCRYGVRVTTEECWIAVILMSCQCIVGVIIQVSGVSLNLKLYKHVETASDCLEWPVKHTDSFWFGNSSKTLWLTGFEPASPTFRADWRPDSAVSTNRRELILHFAICFLLHCFLPLLCL